tara:strand:+ start:238 stop:483 length:246 start_codon:yes stop_codon:yes gene_type:complete
VTVYSTPVLATKEEFSTPPPPPPPLLPAPPPPTTTYSTIKPAAPIEPSFGCTKSACSLNDNKPSLSILFAKVLYLHLYIQI